MATLLYQGDISTSSVGGSPNAYVFRLEIWLNSQSIPNNTSNVTYKALVKPNSNWGFNGFSAPKIYLGHTLSTDNVYVQLVEQTLASVTKYSDFTEKSSWTGDVTHNDRGELSINAYVGYEPHTSSYSYLPASTGRISTFIPIPTIPRASSLTATNADIDGKSYINISRASNSFTHNLYYKLPGQANFNQIASGVGNYYEWTTPTSFYQLIGKNSSCTIRCQTYSGSTAIGDPVDTAITITANESLCKPVINSAVLSDINPITTGLTSNNLKMVRYRSTAEIILSATLKNYATLSSLVINGERVTPSTSVSGGATTISYTYTKTNISSTLIPIVITDSRGYTNAYFAFQSTNLSGANYFELIPYVELTISPNFKRIDRTSGRVELEYTGNFYNGEFSSGTSNVLTLNWAVREKGTETYTNGTTSIAPTIDNNTYSNGALPIELTNPITGSEGLFNYQKIYEFIIYYDDLIEDGLSTSPQLITKGISNFGIFENAILMNGKNIILDMLHPVGSLYISVLPTEPEILFGGGTWERINGYYLYAGTGGNVAGSNTSGGSSISSTGGTAITEAQMPPHNHGETEADNAVPRRTWVGGTPDTFMLATSGTSSWSSYPIGRLINKGSGQAHSHSMSHTHGVTPLRYEVYAWKRIG